MPGIVRILLTALAFTPSAALAGHLVPGGGAEPRIAFDFDDPTPASRHVTERLAFGLAAEIEVDVERHFDLAPGNEGNKVGLTPSTNLSAALDLTDRLFFFGELELSRAFIDGTDNDAGTRLESKEAKLVWRDALPGLTATIGRMDVSDPREWLLDEQLDGIDLVWRTGGFALEAAFWRKNLLRQNPLGVEPGDEPDLIYLRGYLPIGDESNLGAWALGSFGREDGEGDRLHLGLSAAGEIRAFTYWAESAVVLGREENRNVRGVGFDIGAIRSFDAFPLRPYLSAGIAFGSGDDGNGTDTAFRQTGLEDNTAGFGGVTSYKSYGEVFDPQLSNLIVPQLSVGIRPTDRSSIDLAYRKLIQHRRSDVIQDTALDADPIGEGRDLGDEIDLVVGIGDDDGIHVEAVGGMFLPGRAFEDRDPAYFVSALVRIEF